MAHLSRLSFEVLLQHAQLNNITGMPDHSYYGNRVTAPDVAVQTLHTVETEGTGHPKPSLFTHSNTFSDVVLTGETEVYCYLAK